MADPEMLQEELPKSQILPVKDIDEMETTIDHLALSVLDNFETPQRAIRLTSRLSIVHVDTLEEPAQRLLELHSHHFSNTSTSPTPAPYVLLYHFVGSVPEPFRDHYNLMFGAGHQFTNVLAALQIVKDGKVGRYPEQDTVSGIEAFTRFADPFYFFNEPDIPYQPIAPETPRYILDDEADIDFLRQILKIMENTTVSVLRIVLTRLNRQFSREDIADRIIDAVIALEALYLYGINEELKYRLSVRVATHLGRDSAEKHRLVDVIGSVYNVRSKIAHGELYLAKDIEKAFKSDFRKNGWASTDAMLDEVIALLRRGVRSILVDVGEHRFKRFHPALDEAIVEGRQFRIEDFLKDPV